MMIKFKPKHEEQRLKDFSKQCSHWDVCSNSNFENFEGRFLQIFLKIIWWTIGGIFQTLRTTLYIKKSSKDQLLLLSRPQQLFPPLATASFLLRKQPCVLNSIKGEKLQLILDIKNKFLVLTSHTLWFLVHYIHIFELNCSNYYKHHYRVEASTDCVAGAKFFNSA